MKRERAIFAGGCFWCIEAAFEALDGVEEAIVGYTGGKTENPSYGEVCSGETGHYEAVEVYYDSSRIGYKELLDVFWRNIDPFDSEGQFVDKGGQYGTVIFYLDEKQRRIAEKSKGEVEKKFDKKVATKILPAEKFYRAEEEHQGYYKKHVLGYKLYKKGSGREKRLGEIWKD